MFPFKRCFVSNISELFSIACGDKNLNSNCKFISPFQVKLRILASGMKNSRVSNFSSGFCVLSNNSPIFSYTGLNFKKAETFPLYQVGKILFLYPKLYPIRSVTSNGNMEVFIFPKILENSFKLNLVEKLSACIPLNQVDWRHGGSGKEIGSIPNEVNR